MSLAGRERRESVNELLAEESPILLLAFKQGKHFGLATVSRSNDMAERWHVINIPDESRESSDPQRIGAFFVGVGNNAQIEAYSVQFKELLHEEITALGMHRNTFFRVIKQFASFMSDEYRALEVEPPSVEFAIFSIQEGGVKTVRVKANGEFHPAQYFCVLGGYQEVFGGTFRSRILEILHERYDPVKDAKELPTLTEMRKMVRNIFSLCPTLKGNIIENMVTFSVNN